MREDDRSKVSVIVPVCNVETYLAQCLDSILGQTHRDLEVICLDDGSTDGSLAILEAYAAKDGRVRVVAKENEGYGATCNRGIDMATGRWVSIIEPDDWIDSTMYADMLGFAASFDEVVDVVKCPWTDWFEWDDPATAHSAPGSLAGRLATSKESFTLADEPVLIEGHPSVWSAIYRKGFLDDNGIRFRPYPGAGWADNPFLIDTLARARSIVYLDTPYYNYRADLPFSTLDHKSDEAVARPFDRWLDMLDILEGLGIDDRGILEAHYLRGFNYADGAVFDDGEDNPVVAAKTREMFSRMDPDIVYWHPKLRARRKRRFQEVTGDHRPLMPNPRRMRYLAGESLYQFEERGGLVGLGSRIARFARDRHIEKGTRPDGE